MRHIISTAIFAAVLGFAVPAHAAWQTDLNAAIASGNTTQINQIAASNPDSLGQIALTLLAAAEGKLSTNPTEAAKLYQAAVPFTSEIPTASAPQAVSYINTFVAKAKDTDFQTANPDAAASIFTSSLTISSQQQIAATSPNLYSDTLVASDEFLRRKLKLADNGDALQSQVLLAQQQVTPPNNLTGPQTPQENQQLGTEETVVAEPASDL